MRRREAITLQGRKSLVTVPHSLPPPPTPPPPPRAPSWTLLEPATSPPPRYGHCWAYDKLRGYAILYGGYDTVSFANPMYDTWKWDGTTWTELFPSTNPSSSFTPTNVPGEGVVGGNLVWDAVNEKLLLWFFTGPDVSPAWAFKSYHWDGTNWVALSPSTVPPPGTVSPYKQPKQFGAACSEAPGLGNVLLFGGSDGTTTNDAGTETWVWDGTTWTNLAPSTTPPKRSSAFMAYDSVTEEVLMFGGLHPPGDSKRWDMWGWNGTDWTEKTTTISSLDSGGGKSFVYAVFNGVRIGGDVLNNRDKTWLWDTDTQDWVLTTLSPSPANNEDYVSQRLIWDPDRELATLFGGWEDASPHATLDETWVYDPGTP